MKTTMLVATLALCTLLPMLPRAALAWEPETVTIASGEYPPKFSEQFKYGGLGTRIATEALNRAGIKAKPVYLQWKRGFESVKLVQLDAAIGWQKTPQREHDFYYSAPILTNKVVFFHRKNFQFEWKSIEDISTLKVGATLGYVHAKTFGDAAKTHGGRIEIAPTDKDNLMKLASGRIDVFPCGFSAGYHIMMTQMANKDADKLTHHPKPWHENPLHLIVSKKHPNGRELIARFNAGLKELHDMGLYEQYEMESLQGKYHPLPSKFETKPLTP